MKNHKKIALQLLIKNEIRNLEFDDCFENNNCNETIKFLMEKATETFPEKSIFEKYLSTKKRSIADWKKCEKILKKIEDQEKLVKNIKINFDWNLWKSIFGNQNPQQQTFFF